MKSFNLLAISACITLVFFSCEKQSFKIDSERSFSSPFKSLTHQQIIVKDEQSTLLLLVKNISDRRCLNHLDCEDPGEAAVRIEVSNMNNSKTETLLYLGTMNGETKLVDSVNVEVDDKQYTIHLTSVTPHPFEAPTPSDKFAEMVLTKR